MITLLSTLIEYLSKQN